MNQLTIFDFIQDTDYIPFYTFKLISANDYQSCCGSIWQPHWNGTRYYSKCPICQKIKENFHPSQMCQWCGCVHQVYEVFVGETSLENKCKNCIEKDPILSKDFLFMKEGG